MGKYKKTRIKKDEWSPRLDKNLHKLDYTKEKKWVVAAIELMEKGFSNYYIREHIAANKEGSVSQGSLDKIMTEANAEIVSRHFNKAEEIIPLHINQYNNQIEWLLAVKDGDDIMKEYDPNGEGDEDEIYDMQVTDPKKYWYLREKKVRAYLDCLDTMKLKEELMQFHNKDFVINLNVEEKVEFKESPLKVNLNKYTLQEQVELLSLLTKAKKLEFELPAIIHTGNTEAETIDVSHEVVEEKPNIEQIKKEELPVSNQSQAKVTHSDPAARLKEAMAKMAAKRFVEAGGTLTDEEKKLIE